MRIYGMGASGVLQSMHFYNMCGALLWEAQVRDVRFDAYFAWVRTCCSSRDALSGPLVAQLLYILTVGALLQCFPVKA